MGQDKYVATFLNIFKGVVTKEGSRVRGDHEKFEGACTEVLQTSRL